MSNTSILIVEDEAIVAADLSGKLKQLGYDVVGTVARGEEAVELVGRRRPQLVLMDIHLQGPMDGIEAAGVIGSQFDIPVVYLTAHSDTATLSRAKLTGPFGYVLKPFDERDLATQIEMAIHRHRTDRQLREQREWLRVTLTSIGDAVIATDDEGRITFLNPVAEALTGWSTDAASGQSVQCVFRIVDERTGEPLEEPVARVLREGRAVELANHAALVTRDGRFIPIDDSASPILNAAGRIIGVVLVFHDVTEKRRAEEALRENERFITSVAETSPHFLYVFDFDTMGLSYANRSILRDLGHPPDESHPVTSLDALRAFIPPDEMPHFGRLIEQWQSMPDGHVRDDEYRLCHADGDLRYFAGREIVFARRADGTVRQILGLLLDITERKLIEEELAAAKISADRAKAVAEHANRAKDEFLAVLSHELRTPLTPVAIGVSMLQGRADLEPVLRETLEMIQHNVEMEARLIDDLLDVTRISRGKIELHRSAVELHTIVQRAIDVCQSDIDSSKLRFSADLGETAYWIEADVARLQQVFWNLLKNAVKFTPPGGCVSIRCQRIDKQVLVEVTDSGIGIDAKALARIFNAFEQVERSITRQFGGLGLGLTISKSLVEMHGGTIEAQSGGTGRGSTFQVRLPLVEPPSQRDLPAITSTPKHTCGPLRILLVEDHGVTAKMMKMILSYEGHAVEWAGNVVTALDLADRHPFDLLLSDLGLPDGTGYDLIRQLRAGGHQFPAIALSGYGQEADVDRSYEAGFAAHLTKPAPLEAVFRAVADVTRSDRVVPAVIGPPTGLNLRKDT